MDHWNEVSESEVRITPRLVDSFYREAMSLTDEARSYLEDSGREERDRLAGGVRVSFACESLKITTRVMHITAWLLTQRAIETGEIPYREGTRPQRRLGRVQDSDPNVVERLPPAARRLVNASADLYARVKRLATITEEPPQSPARALMNRLERGLSNI